MFEKGFYGRWRTTTKSEDNSQIILRNVLNRLTTMENQKMHNIVKSIRTHESRLAFRRWWKRSQSHKQKRATQCDKHHLTWTWQAFADKMRPSLFACWWTRNPSKSSNKLKHFHYATKSSRNENKLDNFLRAVKKNGTSKTSHNLCLNEFRFLLVIAHKIKTRTLPKSLDMQSFIWSRFNHARKIGNFHNFYAHDKLASGSLDSESSKYLIESKLHCSDGNLSIRDKNNKTICYQKPFCLVATFSVRAMVRKRFQNPADG